MGILDRLRPTRLVTFQVQMGGLSLQVQASEDLTDETRAAAIKYWEQVEAYVVKHPSFKSSRIPLEPKEQDAPVVRMIGEASSRMGVGPMVCLPGALVEAVATDLSVLTREVMVSTEGDFFVVGERTRVFSVEPGRGDDDAGVAVRVRGGGRYAFYSSTGRVRIDPAIDPARAVAVRAEKGAMAAAVGSAMGSAMHRKKDVDRALDVARGAPGVIGAVILVEGRIGVWGDLELVSSGGR